jgi:hypothetical protein
MPHGLAFYPCFFGLLLASGAGCDGGTGSPPDQDGTSYAQTAAGQAGEPKVAVDVVINRAPRIASMLSSAGRVDGDVPVTLVTTASDPDGDKLAFLWTSTCPGTFDRTDAAEATFTTPALPEETADCAFNVVVSDGHGGDARGTLTLSAVRPKMNVGPVLGPVAQSTDLAAADHVVVLHAAGCGQSLTWTWTASAGTLSDQRDTEGGSDVAWRAPATPGTSCTITVTATDRDGASTHHAFTVGVSS